MINNQNNNKIKDSLDVLRFIENEDYNHTLQDLVDFTINCVDNNNYIQFIFPLDYKQEFDFYIQIDRSCDDVGVRVNKLTYTHKNIPAFKTKDIGSYDSLDIINTKKDEFLVLTYEREYDLTSYYIYIFKQMAKQLKKGLHKQKLTIDIQSMS
jgi:hypothetical protein